MEKNSVHQFSSQILFGSTQKGQIFKLLRINVPLLLNPGTVLICQCEHFPPARDIRLSPVNYALCIPNRLSTGKGGGGSFHKKQRHPSYGKLQLLKCCLALNRGQRQADSYANDCLIWKLGFPSGSGGKESTCNAGDPGSIPVSGRSPGEGNRYPLPYSCLENPMNRRPWQATVHGVAELTMTDLLSTTQQPSYTKRASPSFWDFPSRVLETTHTW